MNSLNASPSQPGTSRASAPRRYDLDALRGFAMLLGIALHAAIPFVPYWEEGDGGGSFLSGLFEFVHGFRMPLFFILSGFFTTLLWRRRGLRALVKHRLRRVGLPLLVSVFVVLPLVVTGIIIGYVISGTDVEGDAAAVYDNDIAKPDLDKPDIDKPDKEKSSAVADKNSKKQKSPERQPFGFSHLWFLWFLLWMVAGFAAVAASVGWLARRAGKERPVPSIVAATALTATPFLAVVAAHEMSETIFGPDTSDTFIPDGAVLAYYAAFFSFGALAFDRRAKSGLALLDAAATAWQAQLAFAAVVLFPLGQYLLVDHWTLAILVQVAFAWMMSFGLLGAFSTYLSAKSFRVRWLSDASYWMYLMHLPLVFVAQGIAVRLELPALLGFVLICVTITPLLLVSYRYVVRYSFIGSLLNGPRTRQGDDLLRSQPTNS